MAYQAGHKVALPVGQPSLIRGCRSVIALLLLVTATAALAQTAYVIDGDTLEVAGERVRLWGIDAVEGDQICQRDGRPWQCGDDATRSLQTLVDLGEITCTEMDRDRYGRSVATCTIADQDIGAAMIRSG